VDLNAAKGQRTAMTSETIDAYAGDLAPQQAWDLLSSDSNATLVDVRSQPEWSFVGLPDLSSLKRRPLLVPWQSYSPATRPPMTPNAAFAADVEAAGIDKSAPVIFLCRSGVRSKAAAVAMTARGYRRCYNLAGGFEGPHDDAKHRGRVAGWKAAGLPWTQE
jgi:rhodanese-related sulfurtransferase